MSGVNQWRSRRPAVLCSLLISNYSIYPATIITSILLIEMADSLGTVVEAVSQAVTLSSLAGFASALAMGALSVRYNGRRLLLLGLLLLSLSNLGTAATNNLALLFLLYPANGLALNIVFPMLTALVADHYEPEKRPKVMGWLGASGGFSYMLGAPIVSFLAMLGSWRLAFMAYAAVIPLAAFFLASAWLPPSALRARSSLSVGYRAIRSNGSALASLASVTLMAAAGQSLYFYSFTYIREVHAVSRGQASLVFSVASLAFLLGSFFCGSFVERLGLKKVVTSAMAVACASLVAFPYLPGALCIIVVVIGHFFFSLQYSSLNAIILEQVPEYRGSMMSLSSALSYVGYALGTGVGGLLLLAFSGWDMFSAVFGAMAVGALVVNVFRVRDPVVNRD